MDITLGRVLLMVMVACILSTYAYKVYQNAQLIHKPAIKLISAAALLQLLSSVSGVIQPQSIFCMLVGTVAIHYSMLFAYFGTDRLMSHADNQMYHDSVLTRCTMLTMTTLIMSLLRAGELANFFERVPYTPSWPYYASCLLYFVTPMYPATLLVVSLWRNSRQKSPVYALRMIAAFSGFLLGLIGGVVALVSVTRSLLIDDTLRFSYNQVYHDIRPVVAFLFAVASLPQVVFSVLVYPFERRQSIIDRRNQELLSYLHQKMVTIVPWLHLPITDLQPKRLLVEINDIRPVIFSHISHVGVLTPAIEAEHLALYPSVYGAVVLGGPGPYQPPTLPSNTKAHTLAVARKLKEIEACYARNRRALDHHSAHSKVADIW